MKNKNTLLITGGTGSFGQTVLSKFLNDDFFNEIRVFSRDEKKQDDLRKKINSEKVKFFIGDVRDENGLRTAINGVDYIFHAAALKQVPSCEFFPMEAVKTNIIGTDNVLKLAEQFEVSKVVVLSTDKAAYPINAMGISKALMEKVMIARSRLLGNKSNTIFCATRYGNVMASRGSVIPLFINQIKKNEPLTVTDPKMTRFMMTLDDAVELVIYAFKNGEQGDLFVQKAPSATIGVLAKSLIEIYNSKSKIKIIGTRHGEKLYETLVNREEMFKAEDLGNYYKIPADNRSLNYDKFYLSGKKEISRTEEYHSHNTELLDIKSMKKMLMKLPIIKKDL